MANSEIQQAPTGEVPARPFFIWRPGPEPYMRCRCGHVGAILFPAKSQVLTAYYSCPNCGARYQVQHTLTFYRLRDGETAEELL